ncbi:MAG TPA: DUF3500 domain-containing protein [Gemmatimonadaceae bacterium]|nr:DUF3500 domain-containing protein [Gemmatimonadaceae bacterium]
MSIIRVCVAAFLVVLLGPAVGSDAGRAASEEMTRAATAFLSALSSEQRAKARFSFGDAERVNWHYVPRERRGLPLKEMSEPQRALARALLESGLGQRGHLKATTIMELELVLREMGQNPAVRDPELYYFTIFGAPSDGAPWGWRVEGHHLSVNFTIVAGSPAATTPAFFGANPAEVRVGTRQGFRALAAEEDLARRLVTSLDAGQQSIAIIAGDAPRDIVTGSAARVDPIFPAGIPTSALRPDQVALLVGVIDEYLARMSDRLAAERRARLERTDFGRVTFAWAGSIARGEPHYYRIQGPSFLIEYDNTQNDANHVHTVWRDFEGDFGRDLIREHYRDAPHPH